jgi:threonyl-tRNA synthetase
VVGPKEAEAGTVSVRHRSKGDLGPKPLADLVEGLQPEIESRTTESTAVGVAASGAGGNRNSQKPS